MHGWAPLPPRSQFQLLGSSTLCCEGCTYPPCCFFLVKVFLSFSERRNRSIVGGEVEACSVGKKAEGKLWSCNGPSEESGVPQSLAVRLCLVRESTREMTKEEKVNVSEARGLPFAVSQSTKSSTAAGFPPSSAPGLSETCR